ncbi:MAG: M23 family metallopeptidase [Trueperaceae bacterium]|nr:M23 family metallopeptidase [Trueperaceae bacterium]
MRSGWFLALVIAGLLASCAPQISTETIVLPKSELEPAATVSSTLPAPSVSLGPIAIAPDYAFPIPNPSILSRFGEQGSGIILRTPQAGEAVVAVQAGTVTAMSKFSANDGYIVTIEHADQLSTTYLNLQAVPLVRVGDLVSKNQVIGYLGGGSLTPANVLKFFASRYLNGSLSFIDPASLMHFN